jgi:hypothetical protein
VRTVEDNQSIKLEVQLTSGRRERYNAETGETKSHKEKFCGPTGPLICNLLTRLPGKTGVTEFTAIQFMTLHMQLMKPEEPHVNFAISH